MEGFCEHGHEFSSSIKYIIFDQLSNYELFKEYLAP
jgi:hypothetical protein